MTQPTLLRRSQAQAVRLPDGQSPREVAPAVVRPSCWWALLVGAPPALLD